MIFKKNLLKKLLISLLSFFILGLMVWFAIQAMQNYRAKEADRQAKATQEQAIEDVIVNREEERLEDDTTDPFGNDERVKILLVGLDKRVGQTHGHCDAIQLIDIDKKSENVTITAVPRGTYSPLPYGVAVTSSQYYVSNACGLVGLDYGIEQIERILGQQADYIVIVGFSETLGILRSLKLPTTETLAWLRHRQGYAIGEPQRARNHSTFIKQMMGKFIPDETSSLDTPLHYVIYKMVQTDLSFNQTQQIIDTLSDMNIRDNPEKITLSMRPNYHVQDITYDPETAGAYVSKMINPIKHLLTSSYTDKNAEEIQAELVEKIINNLDDPEFILWTYDNYLWLQIDDDEIREQIRWDIFTHYLETKEEKETRKELLADYILEMEQLEKTTWAEKARGLLDAEVNG